ncbi:MAG TPA: DNA-3-methyladenine glycosylase 2 family protein [Candidatus Paceibacterota bacterium]
MYKKALAHFKKADPKLHAAGLEFEIEDIQASNDLFRDIAWTIIGQQLSGKAADTIFARFEKLFPAGRVVPEHVPKLLDVELRGSGLSGAKAKAIRSLAEHVTSGSLDLAQLPALADADVVTELTKVKGIGPWTAEMILMFSLGRMDIFSMGDLILRKGIMEMHGWKKAPSEKKLKDALAKWSPYRTYAAKILWRINDKRKQEKKNSK